MIAKTTFDWSAYEGAYGSSADVPERLLAARAHTTSDELSDSLGQLAVFGLDAGHLTEAGAPLAGLFLDEALVAMAQKRPVWPYCVHVVLSLKVGRADAGLAPTQFFSPVEAEAVRVRNAFEQASRRKQVQREVGARLSALLAAVEIAAALDAVHLVALLHSADLLAADGHERLARLYERLETNAQRASLLLPWAANLSPAREAAFKRAIDMAAADSSPYLRAAAWAVSQAYPRARRSAAPVSTAELLTLIAASDLIESDYVWYDGLLGGLVCQAIVAASLPRSEQLELLVFCLRRELRGVTDFSMPLAGLAASAAWQVFRLAFGRHYQCRRPLDHADLTAEELATLRELRSARSNWLDLGHQYPSQFGIPEFSMEIDHLLEPHAALQRELGEPWPGELKRSTIFSGLLRPLQFQRASVERSCAFALVARRLLADRDDEEVIAALLASARLPGFPCRELCLALHHVGVDPDWEGVPPPAISDATSFRDALRAWASEPVADALCEIFELRVGPNVAATSMSGSKDGVATTTGTVKVSGHLSEIRRAWTGTLGLPFEISACQIENGPPFIRVAVSGPYNHHAARLLPMVAAAALANQYGSGFGLIFDLSNLDYVGGDGLLDWVYLATKQAGPEYFLAVVLSQRNREPITSLIADLQLEDLDGRHFDSQLAAEAALFSRWKATVKR